MFIRNSEGTRITELKDLRVEGAELYVNGEKFETLDSPEAALEEAHDIGQAIADMDDIYDLAHDITSNLDDDFEDDYDFSDDDDFPFGEDEDEEEDGGEDDYGTEPVERGDGYYLDPLVNMFPLVDDSPEELENVRYMALILMLTDTEDGDEGEVNLEFLDDQEYAHYRKEELKGRVSILSLYSVEDGKIRLIKN